MMSVEDHRAALHNLMRRHHEEYVVQVREWAETAEAEKQRAVSLPLDSTGNTWARLEAMPKPWETPSP
jgi:hypothetical protein